MKKMYMFLMAFMLSLPVLAAKNEAPKASCSDDTLKIGTGPAGKGYSKLFSDINKVCGSVVPICEVNTSGGLDNLTGLSVNEQDIGLTQIDTVIHMQNGDENIKELLAIMSINSNFLHMIVSSNGYTVETKKWGGISKDVTTEFIKKASDMKGKTVALVGSAQLLGRKLNDQFGLGMNIIDAKSDGDAFMMVRKGQAHAAWSVSGWPSGPVSSLGSGDGLTLVPFDLMANTPYNVKPVNYKNLGVYNVQVLGIPNVLMTRPFKGEKVAMVSKLKGCIKTNMVKLQEGSYQPAWKEVKDVENTYGWAKFQGDSTKTANVGNVKVKK